MLIIDVCSFKMVCKSHMIGNVFQEYLGNPSLGLYWLKGRVIAIIHVKACQDLNIL